MRGSEGHVVFLSNAELNSWVSEKLLRPAVGFGLHASLIPNSKKEIQVRMFIGKFFGASEDIS